MSTALERQSLAQPLNDYAQAANLPVDWPNFPFDKPEEGSYLRFTVVEKIAQQIEMGSSNNTHRVYGSLIIGVFIPAGTGDGDGLRIGDEVGALYRQKAFNFTDSPSSGHVRMRDPVVTTVGRVDAYYMFNVTIPFHRDDLP